MRKMYCDKCGREINGNRLLNIRMVLDFPPQNGKYRGSEVYDLCEDCGTSLKNWMRIIPPEACHQGCTKRCGE